jgi:hypothetical protein
MIPAIVHRRLPPSIDLAAAYAEHFRKIAKVHDDTLVP